MGPNGLIAEFINRNESSAYSKLLSRRSKNSSECTLDLSKSDFDLQVDVICEDLINEGRIKRFYRKY